MSLEGKKVVLGVTGSIAAYKAVEIASQMTSAGASVSCIMTREATEFVSALTFRSVTGNPVVTGMFELSSEFSVEHVALAQMADIVVIAPATANLIAKLAVGIADDMLTCTVLATKAPIVIAPAMNANMYQNPVTQQNILRLSERGFIFVGPGSGWLACGSVGVGRMSEPGEVVESTNMVLARGGDLSGRRIVVTAGGQEPVDPVRVITNRSSGKMGYSIAIAARDRGAEVILVSAPTSLPKPQGVKVVNCVTAEDMYHATVGAVRAADVLIMAAAVADYRPASFSSDKIKKSAEVLEIRLKRTVDILASVKGPFIKVGFAAESRDLTDNAMAKLLAKKLDLIVANDITESGTGFGSDNCHLVIIDRNGSKEDLRVLPKERAADHILDRVKRLIGRRRGRRPIA